MSVRTRVVAALLNRHAHNCTHQEGPTMPSNPLSSLVETTEGSARPIPPEEANGLTSGPEGYLCCEHCIEDPIHDVKVDGHDLPCTRCRDTPMLDTIARLTRERDEAFATIARMRTGRS